MMMMMLYATLTTTATQHNGYVCIYYVGRPEAGSEQSRGGAGPPQGKARQGYNTHARVSFQQTTYVRL